MSPYRSFVTQGRFCAIETPAGSGHQREGMFQRELRHAFRRARNAGIERPVVVGAIPFDADRPPSLFIPQSSHGFDRQTFLQGRNVRGGALPQVIEKVERPLEHDFRRMVAQAVEATGQQRLSKVVLSRLLDITTREPVDTAALMRRIVAQNPASYNFHVPLDDGALLGASPELLLRKIGRRFYSTPLAGSARRDAEPDRDAAAGRQLLDSAKDRYEHQLVIDQMREVLSPYSEGLNVPSEPGLVNTPTLWHLATAIDGDVADPEVNALSLACLLHPTPALCGAPTDRARRLIRTLEPFDRDLFGGMVGWCDEEGNGEWVVTIRCARVAGNQVRLFAGAGIVPASTPESEWRETGVKLNTMLSAFGLH
ncbi:isochorismate synthase [Enterobacteriales bacterium SAP-6]|uniref:isochorismate synthase n=2 Tax=Acerihabitans arboris TaxID=2691583 RepID=A0A845SIS0_9GAMM|nr:isochorismate synthase [Acerihabitans arboris]